MFYKTLIGNSLCRNANWVWLFNRDSAFGGQCCQRTNLALYEICVNSIFFWWNFEYTILKKIWIDWYKVSGRIRRSWIFFSDFFYSYSKVDVDFNRSIFFWKSYILEIFSNLREFSDGTHSRPYLGILIIDRIFGPTKMSNFSRDLGSGLQQVRATDSSLFACDPERLSPDAIIHRIIDFCELFLFQPFNFRFQFDCIKSTRHLILK